MKYYSDQFGEVFSCQSCDILFVNNNNKTSYYSYGSSKMNNNTLYFDTAVELIGFIKMKAFL